ncbi:hypothetical protein LCGC14_0937090 [marine sediment metagenome]|uniref:Uncharacterized protein n=1 Tax=marine sediment metagenome TaxID=412755 RepID=A0A0F9P7C8_9ZZZZ
MAEKIKQKETTPFSDKLMETLRELPVNIFIVITGLFLLPKMELQLWFGIFYALIFLISFVNGVVDLYEIWWLN